MTDPHMSRTAGTEERAVPGLIHYLADDSVRPEVWNEDFSRNRLPLTGVTMTIEDASRRPAPSVLDEAGFTLVPFRDDWNDLADCMESRARYQTRIGDMLRDLAGADQVGMALNSVVRRSAPVASANHDNGLPVTFAHCDCSEAGVWYMLEWGYPPPPPRPAKRIALYNIWRLLSPGPTNLPLAVCDARSVKAGDVVPGDSRFQTSGIAFESGFLRANPDHRWSYYSELSPSDVLIFKQYDTDRRHAFQVPHTAFVDESCPSDAAPRISIEVRAVAYWFDN